MDKRDILVLCSILVGAGIPVGLMILVANGIIANAKNPIKILGDGDIDHPIKVKAHKFSTSAKSKIISAGGSAEEI